MQHKTNPINIFLYGLTGRMGLEIAALTRDGVDFCVVGGSSLSKPSPLIPCDVAIDFSSPTSLASNLKETIDNHTPLLIGTTGLSPADFDQIKAASHHIPILQTSNTSIGVSVLKQLVQKAAQLLNEDYDIEIFETHHRQKIDSPSGTALSLGKSAALGRSSETSPTNIPQMDRNGIRKKGSIGYAAHRGGGILGDHSVRFIGDEEVVELSHRCLSRRLFARGALHAAKWLSQQPAGLYTMEDVR